jgi:D-alanine-D-alanine ligase
MQKIRRPLSVAILYYAGTHKDDEDTISGVKGIEESLKRTGHTVRKIIVTKQNLQQALTTPGDIVFNFVEDDTWELYEKIGYGLERLGRAQVGHDVAGLKYAVRKSPMKHLMKKMRISTPNYKIFAESSKRIHPGNLRFPIIIKPANQHAGIGISQESVVTNEWELRERVTAMLRMYQGEVLAEEFIEGREIHITILGNGKNLTVLPYCEIEFKGKFVSHWNVYTYDAKWAKNTWEYADARVDAPATISSRLSAKIKTLALKTYRVFRCRDIARIDVRVDEKDVQFVVDINMNPSINYYDEQDATLASVYALGWTYEEFIERLLAITYRRVYGNRRVSG